LADLKDCLDLHLAQVKISWSISGLLSANKPLSSQIHEKGWLRLSMVGLVTFDLAVLKKLLSRNKHP
jgi:hypothetical protein